MKFKVIDKKTGKEADVEEIALHEDWAKGLVYCDIEGFAITEDGELILADECGKFAYCPDGRFEVQFDADEDKSETNPTITCWYDFDRGYEKGYEKGVRDTKKDYERPTGKWLASVIEELESRKSYGVEYAQAMEDVIAILTAKLRADTEERG
ncbi:MAG: hypothetical protein J6L84_01315 [Clostridiales bacterium]|nr:hypothetical protein [Clostridiales bacterium]MBP3811030.1 hypothetical protein [Clostridiales bacterium]